LILQRLTKWWDAETNIRERTTMKNTYEVYYQVKTSNGFDEYRIPFKARWAADRKACQLRTIPAYAKNVKVNEVILGGLVCRPTA
jgi:hypothetical protein